MRVVIQHLPAWTRIAAAWRSRITPDEAVNMKLKQSRAGGRDADGFGVIVQFLPTWTAVPVARRSQEMPNPAIVMQLVQLVAGSCNGNSGGGVCWAFPIPA